MAKREGCLPEVMKKRGGKDTGENKEEVKEEDTRRRRKKRSGGREGPTFKTRGEVSSEST